MAADRATDWLIWLLGCRHHPNEPHRPYCEVTLDRDDTETYRTQSHVEWLEWLKWLKWLKWLDRLDRFDPDDREPAGGNPYWADTEDTRR